MGLSLGVKRCRAEWELKFGPIAQVLKLRALQAVQSGPGAYDRLLMTTRIRRGLDHAERGDPVRADAAQLAVEISLETAAHSLSLPVAALAA
jgi:hypothetical protein